mgnify:CR=1 FL=1
MMAYDYNKLLGRIVEKVGTQSELAKRMGLSEHSISQKLNNKLGWKQDEIRRMAEILNIASADIPAYFFTEQVQN